MKKRRFKVGDVVLLADTDNISFPWRGALCVVVDVDGEHRVDVKHIATGFIGNTTHTFLRQHGKEQTDANT